MSTIIFSNTFIEKINTILRRFWWAGVQQDDPSNPIAYRSWDDICQSKRNGGLGIRDLHTVNKSLVIHTAYDIANSKNPLLTAVLKTKNYPHQSFWKASNNTTKSVFWSSLLQIKQELTNNVAYQIHQGNSSI
jgi:hypothetical protein